MIRAHAVPDAGRAIPLPVPVRRAAERRLGHDLRRVRVHADATAHRAAAAVGARAFTVGEHVVLGGGYAPGTAAGRRLLHHELAHVVQQATGRHRGLGTEADAEHRAAAPERAGPPRPLPTITAPALQRYRVPGELPCREVVDWLNTNSPYAPEWAETRCNYSFDGGVRTSSRTLPGGRVALRARGHDKIQAVADCPIDRPEWTPTPRPRLRVEQRAWREMRTVLDAHEQRHRAIGMAWRVTLQGRYRALDFTVEGADQAEATQAATDEVARREQAWQADAQAAQDAIDPFRGARLTCPEAP